MPEKKGRKRRPRERRHGEPAVPRTDASPAAARNGDTPHPISGELPSLRVRYAGFVLGLLTLFIGIVTFADAFTGGRGGVDFVMRLAAGAALILLALIIAALTLVPERIRAFLRR